MQVTVNNVRDALIAALTQAFPDIPISGEGSTQPVDPPRFLVQLLESTHTQELGSRYRREFPFVVSYYSPGQTHSDMYEKAEQLTSSLNWIATGGGRFPGQNMRFQIMDEVLLFYVTYRLLLWDREIEAPKMQELKQEGTTRET